MTKNRGKRELTARRRVEMARLYKDGLTLRQIGDIMGLTYQSVHAHLMRAGVPMRPRGNPTGYRRR